MISQFQKLQRWPLMQLPVAGNVRHIRWPRSNSKPQKAVKIGRFVQHPGCDFSIQRLGLHDEAKYYCFCQSLSAQITGSLNHRCVPPEIRLQ